MRQINYKIATVHVSAIHVQPGLAAAGCVHPYLLCRGKTAETLERDLGSSLASHGYQYFHSSTANPNPFHPL